MVEFFKELRASGVPASDIRGITFSKEAATTIERRTGVKGVFSTFHSLGYLICSETERKPVEPELRHRLMCKLIRKWHVDYKELDAFIARMRREYITPEDAKELESYGMARAYGEYEKERAKDGWMDFDSMLCDAVVLLEKNLQLRARWQVKYLIVDEAQDTDDLQWRMMQLLTEEHGNITVVGDANQCIYGFRGAKPENIGANFGNWFPNFKSFFLGKNYRSTRNIVRFVRENAPKNTPPELLERMVAARDVDGALVALKMYHNEDDEAESALKLAQADPTNSVILARTNRTVGVLERLCWEHSLRYTLAGKTGFFKRNEVRKAVEALKPYGHLKPDAAFKAVLPNLLSKYEVADRTDADNEAVRNLTSLQTMATSKFARTSEFILWATKAMHHRNDAKGVTISTIHQSKGGEWDNVYLINCRDGMMPHKNAESTTEEHRLFFVAISRPKNMLRISFAGTPSLFLRRYINDDMLETLLSRAGEVDKLVEQQKLFT
jgi:superfamily I DNA/RNA helicase